MTYTTMRISTKNRDLIRTLRKEKGLKTDDDFISCLLESADNVVNQDKIRDLIQQLNDAVECGLDSGIKGL